MISSSQVVAVWMLVFNEASSIDWIRGRAMPNEDAQHSFLSIE
jgi:hypothetical protein